MSADKGTLVETFTYQGSAVRYERRGSGEPVVFLHNGGTSHAIWVDVVDRLKDTCETFALDLPGYGASDRPSIGYSLESYVAVLEAFIEHHALSSVVLVGNCMGSAISLTYAMKHADKVRALILVNPLTTATFTAASLGPLLRFRRWAPKLSRALYRPTRCLKLNRTMATLPLRMQFGSIGRAKALYKRDALCACFSGREQMPSLLGALDDLANYAFLDTFIPPENFPPSCTIWGLENTILSAAAGRKLNATLKPREEHWLARTGHLLMLEQPDEVARIVRTFPSQYAPKEHSA